MSGHSKWSKVKHQKATTDVVKARAFTTAARTISVAVREGGGVSDPNHNFRLRLAIEKARQENVPKENIERAIEKGKGIGAAQIEQLTYEAYGPHSVGMLIETITDNRQRTVSLIKSYIENAGGVLATQGAVSYLFIQSGLIHVTRHNISFDDIFEKAVLSGAVDIMEQDNDVEIYCPVPALSDLGEEVKATFGAINISQSIIMKPTQPISIEPQHEKDVLEFIAGLKELDDVTNVYTNAMNI